VSAVFGKINFGNTFDVIIYISQTNFTYASQRASAEKFPGEGRGGATKKKRPKKRTEKRSKNTLFYKNQ